MKKIIEIIQTKDIGVLIKNFFSLAILQVLNIVLPFLTIPYLLRVVGVEKFGLISFALAFVTFFQIVVEYGFNNTATRDISVVATNKDAVEKIYSAVLTTKMFLLGICSVVFLIVIYTIPKFSEYSIVYLFTFLTVIGQAMFPLWLFQGLQQMKYITYLNVIFKSVCTLLIFILVKEQSDYYLAPLLTSLGFIFSGIGALIVAYRKFGIKMTIVSFEQIKEQLIKGKYLFFSEFQIAFIVNANVVIIGFLLNNTAVGYYATAEKVIRAISNLQLPIINALYPHISKLMVENKSKAINQIKKIAIYGSIVEIVGIIILFALSGYLFQIIFGEQTEESVIVFRIMIVMPLLVFLDQIFGKLILLTNNRENHFFKVFFFTSIISVVLCFIMTYSLGFVGTAIANTFVQLLVACGMYYYAKPLIKNSL